MSTDDRMPKPSERPADDAGARTARLVTALHHPVRRRLLDLLAVDGPATVSALAEAAGQRVGNVSHHLKALALAELVEPAPELARDGRERWWRSTGSRVSWGVDDLGDDPAARVVGRAAEEQNLEHHAAKVRAWFAERDLVAEHDRAPADASDDQPTDARAWARAAFALDSWVEVTPDELAEIQGAIAAVLSRYRRDRPEVHEPDAPGRRTAFVFAHGNPAEP